MLLQKVWTLLIRHKMAQETQYTANTGMVSISTANSNLDGTGTLGTVLTASAAGTNGTLIKSVTVKATGNTTQGMVRLFIYDGTNTRLVAEIEVPATTKGANEPAFEVRLETNFALKAQEVLKASTEKAESFNVIAEGLNWAYYTTSVRTDTTKYTVQTGFVAVATANSGLDGGGTLGDVITAASNGTLIQNVIIKATVNTTYGMIRLFLYDGSSTKLLTEIPVKATTASATAHSFAAKVTFNGGGLMLKSGWHLKASTEKAENHHVFAEGLNISYPA